LRFRWRAWTACRTKGGHSEASIPRLIQKY
jgi:hypothetical protein